LTTFPGKSVVYRPYSSKGLKRAEMGCFVGGRFNPRESPPPPTTTSQAPPAAKTAARWSKAQRDAAAWEQLRHQMVLDQLRRNTETHERMLKAFSGRSPFEPLQNPYGK
jgi:hypothetical protein